MHPEMFAICTSYLPSAQNPENIDFLLSIESLSQHFSAQPHDFSFMVLVATYVSDRVSHYMQDNINFNK